MRVLYYAPEYYSNHGGRNHARSFFRELVRDPRVSQAVMFPTCPALRLNEPFPQTSSTSQTLGRRARRLVDSLQRRAPYQVRSQIDLYHPSPSTYAALSATVAREDVDVAILRIRRRFRYIQRLKHDHPKLRVCIEYNAGAFDETLKGIFGERFWLREEARQLDFAECLTVVSDDLCRRLISVRPSLEDKILVNPNGADPEMFKLPDSTVRARLRSQMGIPARAFVVGYAGGMEEWRRVPEIVSWMAGARGVGGGAGLDRLFLVLIGAGSDLQRVLSTIRDLSADLSGHVFCSGSWMPSSEVPQVMAAFDAGLLSFQYPHCCQQKAFEYLLTGLPVIGPAGSSPHSLLSAENGVFEFGHDFASFIATLRRVHDDLDACKAAAARGRGLVASEFTWAANASRVLDALERSR